MSLALLGLYASGITFIGRLGLAAVFSVLVAAAAALTLVPGGLGLLGRRIDALKVRTPVAESGSDSDGWHRYAGAIARTPWRFLVAGLVFLGILTIPLFSINLGHIDDGADPTSFTDKRAYDLIAQGFGAGANGTFTVVVDTRHATQAQSQIAKTVDSALASERGVARASALKASQNGAILVGTVVPTTSPQQQATSSLFRRLVDTTLPDSLAGTGARGYVTGNLATQIQFRDTLTARLPIVIAVVVALAFLLLMTTFRSLLIAVKAAVLNLLSIGAAYGVIVAIFQWGWGGSLFGVSEKVPIESYVPVLMFAIVFGLSMDYEVFLLSRIKEAWDSREDNTLAVADGLSRTARVITCAALIMASVFISFTLSSNVVVKMLAVGLSVSVLVDATIVRLILVPASMTLFGRANWWLPAWLDRVLPHIDAEGTQPPPLPAAAAPEPTGPTTDPEPTRNTRRRASRHARCSASAFEVEGECDAARLAALRVELPRAASVRRCGMCDGEWLRAREARARNHDRGRLRIVLRERIRLDPGVPQTEQRTGDAGLDFTRFTVCLLEEGVFKEVPGQRPALRCEVQHRARSAAPHNRPATVEALLRTAAARAVREFDVGRVGAGDAPTAARRHLHGHGDSRPLIYAGQSPGGDPHGERETLLRRSGRVGFGAVEPRNVVRVRARERSRDDPLRYVQRIRRRGRRAQDGNYTERGRRKNPSSHPAPHTCSVPAAPRSAP